MTDPPERVRVTGPPRRQPPVRRASDIDAGTNLGGVYMRSLLREQLRLAIGVLAVMGLTIGLLPLAFHLAPGLSGVRVLGMPLGWLLLGVLVYPALVGLGWAYVRRAERNERDFAELLSETER
ncbi:membrane protein [Nocardioides sp. URHA0020]|uniref:membrane protein n=1 Tax=Nocardioides sp. URHA0020 TaxID=1380392 RepID=UPI00048DDC60|nr:membrane protein [Nocardioides sp. URHA0020]